MHPVEKILMEETGVKTAEEAKPLIKAWWKAKIADMSPEEIEKLKVTHLFQPRVRLVFAGENKFSSGSRPRNLP